MKTCGINVNTLLWPTSLVLHYSRCYIRPRNQLTPISFERIGGICLYTNKRREGREINRLSKGSMDLNRWTLHHSLDLVAECLQNLRGLSTRYESPDKLRQKTHVKDPWRAAASSVTEFTVMTCGYGFHTTWYQLDNRSTWQIVDTRDESGCQTPRLIAPSRVTYGARQPPPHAHNAQRERQAWENFFTFHNKLRKALKERKLFHTTVSIRRQRIPTPIFSSYILDQTLHTRRTSSARLCWIECAQTQPRRSEVKGTAEALHPVSLAEMWEKKRVTRQGGQQHVCDLKQILNTKSVHREQHNIKQAKQQWMFNPQTAQIWQPRCDSTVNTTSS